MDKWLEDIINKIENKQNEKANTIDYKNDEDLSTDEINIIVDEKRFPKLQSSHCILSEKNEDFHFGIKFNKNIEINVKKKNNATKKNYDGVAFIKLLIEDLKEIKMKTE